MVRAFEEVSGKQIPYEFAERRMGDVAENYADPTLAKKLLGWSANLDLNRMCEDTWRWQTNNPDGYK
jgi:UDP-glucose 4-epimerase